jgi:molybdopterin molybdotransferase/putative molybdopterin biosynthesis protein
LRGYEKMSNSKSKHPRIPREETLRRILERSIFQPRVEIIPVREALGRVTALETRAENTLPNSPSSRLDGIAIKYASLKGSIDNTDHWRNGIEYVFCNTGVGIPDEYDTVIRIENVEFDEAGKLRILTRLSAKHGSNPCCI